MIPRWFCSRRPQPDEGSKIRAERAPIGDDQMADPISIGTLALVSGTALQATADVFDPVHRLELAADGVQLIRPKWSAIENFYSRFLCRHDVSAWTAAIPASAC
jgi:hypothetical protein